MTPVTGTILYPNGYPYRGYVTLSPVTTPAAETTTLYLSGELKVKCSLTGAFTATLAPVTYDASFDTTDIDTVRFSVPDSGTAQNLAELVAVYDPRAVADPVLSISELTAVAPSSGHGSPEGVVVGDSGKTYLDLDTQVLYLKTTDGSSTGWV